MNRVGMCESTSIAQTIRVGSSGKLFVQGWTGLQIQVSSQQQAGV